MSAGGRQCGSAVEAGCCMHAIGLRKCTHARTHACMHACMHTLHKHRQTCMHTQARAYTHARTHTHTHKHKHIHACMHNCTHIHTRTHTCARAHLALPAPQRQYALHNRAPPHARHHARPRLQRVKAGLHSCGVFSLMQRQQSQAGVAAGASLIGVLLAWGHTCARLHTQTHACTHIHKHAPPQACIHTRAHTHIHTHTQHTQHTRTPTCNSAGQAQARLQHGQQDHQPCLQAG